MFQLILHHKYKAPLHLADVSGHANHGTDQAVQFGSDGTSPDSGIAEFDGQQSRIIVPHSSIWEDLTSIRIEAQVKINQLGHRHNIVEGALSFALFVRSDGVLTGAYLGLEEAGPGNFSASNTLTTSVLNGGGSVDPFSTLTSDTPPPPPPGQDMAWIGVNSDTDFAPDGVKRTVPVGQWFTVTFIHNGVGLWLYLNDELVGVRHDIASGVLPVQGNGVHIGAWPGQNEFMLHGALDELRIWKYDPQFRYKKFFCRPMSPEREACWRSLLARIVFYLNQEETREQMLGVLNCIGKAEAKLIRAVLSQGQDVIDRNRRFSERYDELWCSDTIDGPQMQEMTADWGNWIQEIAGDAFWAYQQAIIKCIRDLKGLDFCKELEKLQQCDTAFGGFMGHINTGLRQGLGLVKPNGPCDDPCKDPTHGTKPRHPSQTGDSNDDPNKDYPNQDSEEKKCH